MSSETANPAVILVLVPALIAIGFAACVIPGCSNSKDVAPSEEDKNETIRGRLETLFDAAQNGDVERYLNCFAEPLRSERKAQLGTQAHQKLRAAEVGLRSFVNNRPQFGRDGASAVVVIDKVYPEFQERWRVTLRRDKGGWTITAMQPLKKAAPKTKFGTPVVPELPPRKKLPQ